MKPVRKLRRLYIREVSAVDRAANPHARVVLTKKDTEAMPNIDPAQQAFNLWKSYCGLLAANGDLNESESINAALKSSMGQELFALAKLAKGMPGAETRVDAMPADHSHLDRAGAAELERLRGEHGRKQLDKFNGLVDAFVASGMRRTDAQVRAMSEQPSLWAEAKQARLA
jgi:hypothetical protein